MWYFSKKEKENRYPLDQKKSSLLSKHDLWFLYFIILISEKPEVLFWPQTGYFMIFYEYSVLYLFYSKICQRMSENWKRF